MPFESRWVLPWFNFAVQSDLDFSINMPNWYESTPKPVRLWKIGDENTWIGPEVSDLACQSNLFWKCNWNAFELSPWTQYLDSLAFVSEGIKPDLQRGCLTMYHQVDLSSHKEVITAFGCSILFLTQKNRVNYSSFFKERMGQENAPQYIWRRKISWQTSRNTLQLLNMNLLESLHLYINVFSGAGI